MAKRILRYRGKGRKEDVVVMNNKFMGARGCGIARQLRRKRRRR